jgi:hypothetical protein
MYLSPEMDAPPAFYDLLIPFHDALGRSAVRPDFAIVAPYLVRAYELFCAATTRASTRVSSAPFISFRSRGTGRLLSEPQVHLTILPSDTRGLSTLDNAAIAGIANPRWRLNPEALLREMIGDLGRRFEECLSSASLDAVTT